MEAVMAIPGDNPIRRSDEDVLGRSEVANRFAAQVLSLDVSEGAVAGVLGPWGHGKTSFVNLAREALTAAEIAVLDFNPWMFSGTEQLVESFFTELAAQLRPKPGFAEIAADLASYGDAFSGLGWVPVAGPWIERIRGGAKALSKLLESRREGVHSRREALTKELARLSKPLVVVLDDIDRLTTQEIRDIFRLVGSRRASPTSSTCSRLTASASKPRSPSKESRVGHTSKRSCRSPLSSHH
jgi:predicted KAP-like P-loop ATPase